MSEQTATGESRVLAEGFTAYRSNDQSEGRGGESSIGSFTTVEEAIARAQGQGVQGDPGSVRSYEVRIYEGGLIQTQETTLIARRRTPQGSWKVGWLDLREYAD